MKKGRGLLKAFPVMPVALVAGAAAALFFAYNYMNARRTATGKSPISSVAFSIALLAVGAVSLMCKRVKVVSAPLLMVGATLLGFEAVRRTGLNGLAGRYRLGQNRPASALSRSGRVVEMARPGEAVASPAFGQRVASGSPAWGPRR